MQSSTIIGLISTALAILMGVLFIFWRIPIAYMLAGFLVLMAATYRTLRTGTPDERSYSLRPSRHTHRYATLTVPFAEVQRHV